MKRARSLTRALSVLVLSGAVQLPAEVELASERLQTGSGFGFEEIPVPATNDAGTGADWKMIGGESDPNGAPLSALNDGRVPAGDDEPKSNFFFRAGTAGGRILVDLGKVSSIERIGTYSRHNGARAPQIYEVYAADGMPAPAAGADPAEAGWKKLASVDTRPAQGDFGGRYGVAITDSTGTLGDYSQLLFDIHASDKRDRFGLTFFSEIDIVTSDNAELEFVSVGKPPKLLKFQTPDRKFSFQLDASEAPELLDWSESELAPVVIEWYPKLVELLPSANYEAPTSVIFQYRNDMPAGVPASAGGSRVNLNAPWFKSQLEREAKGCVIHELVHVVQNYWRARLVNRQAKRTPGWITEGLADYVRWFLYEPETRGAILSPVRQKNAKHDASYRISANFIDWVARTYNEEIVRKLNAAAREGRYQDTLWKDLTGKGIGELADAWRAAK